MVNTIKNIFSVLTLFCLSSFTHPTELTAANATPFVVYGMRTDFPMSNDNKYPEKDFYVNLGLAQGIKIGSSLEVFRIVTTDDDISNRKMDNITFRIAKLKIIHAEENISVARLVEMNSKEETPYGIYNTIMIGDLVEVSSKK